MTGSQCKWAKTGVKCSYFFVPLKSCATALKNHLQPRQVGLRHACVQGVAVIQLSGNKSIDHCFKIGEWQERFYSGFLDDKNYSSPHHWPVLEESIQRLLRKTSTDITRAQWHHILQMPKLCPYYHRVHTWPKPLPHMLQVTTYVSDMTVRQSSKPACVWEVVWYMCISCT